MKFPTIHIEGNIISPEILEKIVDGELAGQSPKDFGLSKQLRMRDEISAAWSTANSQWKVFKSQMDKTGKDVSGASETRKYWMVPFLGLLGYELDPNREAWVENNKTYAISHRAVNRGDFPVHIMGFNDSLDMKRTEGGPRMSPHGLVQEYINITDRLYAIVTNGISIRLLRDSSRLIKLSYLEFDLEQMFEEEHYADFSLLFRLLHVSRLPESNEITSTCILEKYHQDSIDSGARIREGLSNAVEKSLVNLGKGFLIHPQNTALRKAIQDKQLSPVEFYRNIRRLIYRLLFLMVAEDRDLIFPSIEGKSSEEKENQSRFKDYYKKYYSIERLRVLSGKPFLYSKDSIDLWKGLLSNFRLFEDNGKGLKMSIYPLDGFLFSPRAINWLEGAVISNELLLSCIRELNWFKNAQGMFTRINYGSLDVEELGSVYEGLLDMQPVIEEGGDMLGVWNFLFHAGTDRKTTGSYYTRPDLVHELIKSALIPVIEERLIKTKTKEEKENTLLSLKICDTAAGSGHILLAAARTIAWKLAKIRTDEENPSPTIYRRALREVIQHCIYGVDQNPDAVELCQLALWIEGHNSGKPLSFLEHKIRCGNSLIGVANLSVLKKGIPDEAFNPITGDDKLVCQALKKTNKAYNKSKQSSFDFNTSIDVTSEQKHFADGYHELELVKQDTVEEIKTLSTKYGSLRNNSQWFKDWRACNLYTSAFFYTYTDINDPAAPTSERLDKFLQNPASAHGQLIGKSDALAMEHHFFHWPLEFPDVFDQGGFDVILGNPPWEIVELNAKEYFKAKNTEIVNAASDKIRKNLIENLRNNDLELYNSFQKTRHNFDAQRKFIQESNRYPTSSKGRIDLYPLFLENSIFLISKKGIISLILPSDIATGAYNSDLFSLIVSEKRLKSYFDFENSKAIFPSVHRSKRFCLLALTGGDFGATTIDFFYFGHDLADLQNKERRITLRFDELELFSPNTSAPPIFQTDVDYKISRRIYADFGVFINKKMQTNLWQASINRMLSLSDKGVDFRKNIELTIAEKYNLSRMYSGKNIFQYNHRFATSANDEIKEIDLDKLIDPQYTIETEYYVPNQELNDRLKDKKPSSWLIGYRDVTNATNERTTIASILPRTACDTNCRNIFSNSEVSKLVCLIGNLNSIPFDYFARQKIMGLHLNAGTLEQLPVLFPSLFTKYNETLLIPKILELSYTSWDIKPFADDIWEEADEDLRKSIQQQWEENRKTTGGNEFNPPDWCEIDKEGIKLPPFKWDEERRSLLKAELDAYYAKLYGLTLDELRYILDPKDVYGEDFPGETFRVLKEKEIKKYGEYRTKRLVLDAFDKVSKLPQ